MSPDNNACLFSSNYAVLGKWLANKKIPKPDHVLYSKRVPCCRHLAMSFHIDYSEENWLGMDHSAAAQWKAAQLATLEGTTQHFITECFFLTARAVHLATEPVLRKLEAVKQYGSSPGSKEKV
jgi:hypothetical protein